MKTLQTLFKNLEIGCGSGKLAEIYLDENKKSKWYGLEPNYDYEKYKIKNFTLERSWFNSEYKLKDNYDAIVHSNMFEHSYNPIEFLQTIRDNMDENAYHFISVPNFLTV